MYFLEDYGLRIRWLRCSDLIRIKFRHKEKSYLDFFSGTIEISLSLGADHNILIILYISAPVIVSWFLDAAEKTGRLRTMHFPEYFPFYLGQSDMQNLTLDSQFFIEMHLKRWIKMKETLHKLNLLFQKMKNNKLL